MTKTDLIALLQQEQTRVNKRLRRHEDEMPASQIEALAGRRDGLAFAIAQIEKLGHAA